MDQTSTENALSLQPSEPLRFEWSDDSRSVVVYLTAAGRRSIDEALSVRLEAARAHLTALAVRERRQLAELLRKVVLDVRRSG